VEVVVGLAQAQDGAGEVQEPVLEDIACAEIVAIESLTNEASHAIRKYAHGVVGQCTENKRNVRR